MKKILILLLFMTAATSAFSARITLYEPRNLDFESSRKGMEPTYWTIPDKHLEAGYQFIAIDQAPAQGDFSARLYIHKQIGTNVTRGMAYQTVSAYRYIGKTIRITFKTRASFFSDTSRAVVFLETKMGDGSFDFNELDDQPVKSYDWEERVIEIKVPNNAAQLTYGIELFGLGDAYLDDIKFEIVQPNKNVKISNESIKLSQDDMTNLIDFANVYGMVRFYNPFFNGLQANWNDVLISGVERITEGLKNDEVAPFLDEHFKPLCPGLKMSKDGELPPTSSVSKQKSTDSLVLSWLHMGAYSANETEYFASQYRNIMGSTRIREGAILSVIKLPKNYHNKTIEVAIKAKQKVYDFSGGTQLWVRVDRDSGYVQSKRKSEILRGNTDWTEHKLQVNIREDDVVAIRIGLIAIGEVDAYFDDVKLRIVETGEEIEVKDFSAENADFHPKPEFGWYYPTSVLEAGYKPIITDEEAYVGKYSFCLKANELQRIRFSQPGEVYTYKSQRGYSFTMPLALLGETKSGMSQTIPASTLNPDMSMYSTENYPAGYFQTGSDVISRITILTDLYTYLKQFGKDLKYGYNDLDNLYFTYLEKVSKKMDADEFNNVLNELVTEFKRPNIFVYNGWENSNFYTFPFRTNFTDDRRLVVSLTYDSTMVLPGTEITKINGENVAEIFAAPKGAYYNYLNSKKYSEYRVGEKNSEIELEFLYPNDTKETVKIKRTHEIHMVQESRPPVRYAFNDSTLYVDVTSWDDKTLMDNREMLNKFKHIILDCRGKININPMALGVFAGKDMDGIKWSFGEYTSPFNKWNSYRETYLPVNGHNYVENKKLYFLVDERSIGFANDLVKLAQYHGLGKVYGRKAPASQYETLYYSLPGDYTLSFTPGKGRLPDGSDIVGGPIIPDVEIKFDKKTASTDLPYLTKVLSDIQGRK